MPINKTTLQDQWLHHYATYMAETNRHAALAHLDLGQQRIPGEICLRVYNPKLEHHGFESSHTLVELVCDDLPFLVDSMNMEIHRHGSQVLDIGQTVMSVQRNASGQLQAVLTQHKQNRPLEAVVRLKLPRLADITKLNSLQHDLNQVIADVQIAVQDWHAMRASLASVRMELSTALLPPPINIADQAEVLAFLDWMADHHFTFLGACVADVAGNSVPNSGLGILRQVDTPRIKQMFAGLAINTEPTPQLLLLTKANTRSTVHRPADLDLVSIRRFAAGQVIGEYRFVGLYGSRVYSCLPQDIPIVRNTMAAVTQQADLNPNSHDARILQHILETYPRDELLQIDSADLYRISMGILQLRERLLPRLFIRHDRYGRFLVCLVYVSRERYDTHARQRIQQILSHTFNATEITFSVNLTESPLARVVFLVRVSATIPRYDHPTIEAQIANTLLSWQDRLQAALVHKYGETKGSALWQNFADAFPAGYREDYDSQRAVADIDQICTLNSSGELHVNLYQTTDTKVGTLRLRIFRRDVSLPLYQAMPMLEHMGVKVEDERPYQLTTASGLVIWIHDFGLSYPALASVTDAATLKLNDSLRIKFQNAVTAVWQHHMDSDGFNALVLRAQIAWRDIVLLRTYAYYLRQTSLPFSIIYMEQALRAHPDIARLLVDLFAARFNPLRPLQEQILIENLSAKFHTALDRVQSLDYDRILRSFFTTIQATLRTNYYQIPTDGAHKAYLAIKLDSQQLHDLPEPHPRCEIFVYSPRMEGVHLRGGLVARGGIRWSDRREDYRTEVLGLMKAQMVKNAVIVPVGAKGGFIVKQLPEGDRVAIRGEVLACYREFIAGLLDLTDNLTTEGTYTPPNLVCYDGTDTYLVVAADKGTASFSDTANTVAASYKFWLGDAFASGGSTGYDHKRMGITARGAWECLRQHMHTLAIDYERQPFSVVGIGDMSGDVFGNGVLWSKQIRLIAAFDHRHIFLDPNPDLVASFHERERLFALANSSWADYNPALISTGGGVYPRTLKSIPLSSTVRTTLGCDASSLTPTELIRVILGAPVDLLWNGGIGTFVKASWERHLDVGDRQNDSLRIDATKLRCRMIGEGGNLGLTQAARIEFAQHGGLVDTDFVHNVGGVNCSDHEVNIKILLDPIVADGLLTLGQRNQLLVDMTDEVAKLVLQDCYSQAHAIGVESAQGMEIFPEHIRLIGHLERKIQLNRRLEGLPTEAQLQERHQLTRPEIAILIAYSKHSLYEDLLASNLPDDPTLLPELENYFPTPLRVQFRDYIQHHRLRREIICTTVANQLINRYGSTFVLRIPEQWSTHISSIIKTALMPA